MARPGFEPGKRTQSALTSYSDADIAAELDATVAFWRRWLGRSHSSREALAQAGYDANPGRISDSWGLASGRLVP